MGVRIPPATQVISGGADKAGAVAPGSGVECDAAPRGCPANSWQSESGHRRRALHQRLISVYDSGLPSTLRRASRMMRPHGRV